MDSVLDMSTSEPHTKTISNLGEGITLVDVNAVISNETELTTTQIVICFSGSLMTVLTFIGQVMVFTVVSHDPRLRTPSNYFIISLAVADLLISVISMPVWTVYSTLGYWPLSQLWCDVWNTFDYVLCIISIYTILFMSIDRFLTLRYPVTYQAKRTPGKAKRALVAIWIITALILTAFIGSTQYVYGKDRDLMKCTTYYLKSPILTFVLTIFVFWSGVGGTAIFYCLIYQIVTKAGRINVKSVRNTSAVTIEIKIEQDDSNSEYTSQETKNSDATQHLKHDKDKPDTINVIDAIRKLKKINTHKRIFKEKERKTLRTIFSLLIVFAVCWLPLSFIFVIEALKPGYLSFWWMIVGYWLGYVNSMLNPVCYAVGNPYFRETLLKLLCKKSCNPDD